jgi:hypothetical protein
MNLPGKTLVTSALAIAIAAIALMNTPRAAGQDDMASFATGGYASGLRTKEMMNAIDVNKDGMISKDEWVDFQEKVFTAVDEDKSGSISKKEHMGASDEALAFATGAYARGLKSEPMFDKMDKNGDGQISHDEFILYQVQVFDMMAPSDQPDMIGPTDFILQGK